LCAWKSLRKPLIGEDVVHVVAHAREGELALRLAYPLARQQDDTQARAAHEVEVAEVEDELLHALVELGGHQDLELARIGAVDAARGLDHRDAVTNVDVDWHGGILAPMKGPMP
jgi:hypothetical protein